MQKQLLLLYAFFLVITQKKAHNIQNTAKAWNYYYKIRMESL